jgi:2Fe-2S ferredoxin
LQVLAGAAHLTPRTEPELRYLAAGRLLPHERLACQVRLPQGEVTGQVPEATKLPHVEYVG